MAARNSTGAKRAAGIPTHPTYRFRAQAQPKAFADGVEAFRNFIVETNTANEPIDDRGFAEKHARTLLDAMSARGPFSLGFAAALAEWLAIARHSEQAAETWSPLETPLPYRMINGGDYEYPPERSMLFEVDGEPVCVTEELASYCFVGSRARMVPLDAVRQRGKAITRERFEELRARATEVRHG